MLDDAILKGTTAEVRQGTLPLRAGAAAE